MSRFFAAYVRCLRRADWCIVLASILCIGGLFHCVKQLRVRSDFKEMLPAQFRSVQELNRIEQRVRATASLLLLVGGEDWPAMRRFIDDFAVRVPTEVGDLINRVDTNAGEVRQFFDKNKYLYIDLPDLQEIHRRLKHHIDKEKLKATGLYTELEEEKFDVTDLEAKYKQKTSHYQEYRDGYFTTPDASLAIVVMKPVSGATNVAFAETLIARVRNVVEAMQPTQYHPSLKIGFGGRYPKVITEFKTIVGDILRTTVLCLTLIGLVVFGYFRRVRMGFFMLVAVGVGTLAALALAYATIGYLTTQTAFLGSIIVGNGINFSIILMARYIEERRERRHPPPEALLHAIEQTWRPTLIAALTASVAYGALSLTQMRGFSQFGFIGGVGMLLCWLATYLILPAWISCSERIWPTRFAAARRHPMLTLMTPVARWIVRDAGPIRVGTFALIAAALALTVWYLPRSLEYDFNNLRFRPAAPEETWEAHARDQVDDIFGQSASPAVILAERTEQVGPICDAVNRRGPTLMGMHGPIYDTCKSLATYVPADQTEKLAVLADIRASLSGSALKFLTAAQRAEVDKFRQTFDLQPVTLPDLPRAIVDNFVEVDGRQGLIVYVYPRSTANLWNGKDLVQFADLIRRVDLPSGETIYSSGEAVIFSDLLQAVIHEGPRVTLYSFCLVVLIVLGYFRERFAAGYVIGSLLIGICWFIGALGLVRVKLNFLNFVALPITFGIGVDYAVNIFQRYRQDGPGSIPHIVQHLGGAVFLCSLTTVIGYSVLLISRNQALVSFGLAALLGELTCLAAALVSLPAFILRREQRAGVIVKDSQGLPHHSCV